MRVPRLFVDATLATGVAIDLPPSQSHYVRNVLRARTGQQIVVFNDTGGEYAGEITAVERSVVRIALNRFVEDDRNSPLDIHIGLAITKRDAMDAAIQKATELGATGLTPVISAYNATSQKSLDKRAQHWLGVIQAACEQCERNRLPMLNDVTTFADFLERTDADMKVIAHPGGGNPFESDTAPSRIAMLVGPEGGFTEDEVRAAGVAGYEPLGLGPRILRADTAPLVMLAIAQAKWGDLFYSSPRTFATDHST